MCAVATVIFFCMITPQEYTGVTRATTTVAALKMKARMSKDEADKWSIEVQFMPSVNQRVLSNPSKNEDLSQLGPNLLKHGFESATSISPAKPRTSGATSPSDVITARAEWHMQNGTGRSPSGVITGQSINRDGVFDKLEKTRGQDSQEQDRVDNKALVDKLDVAVVAATKKVHATKGMLKILRRDYDYLASENFFGEPALANGNLRCLDEAEKAYALAETELAKAQAERAEQDIYHF